MATKKSLHCGPTLPRAAVPRSPQKTCIFARACIGNSAETNQFVVPLDPPLPGPQWAHETGQEIQNRFKKSYVKSVKFIKLILSIFFYF